MRIWWKMKESDLQIQICNYLTMVLPQNAFFFSVNNEAALSVVNAIRAQKKTNYAAFNYLTIKKIESIAHKIVSKFKNMGLTRGVSDLVLCYAGKTFFIELKTKTGQQTYDQKEFAQACALSSFSYYVVRSIEELEAVLIANKIPLKGKINV